jgi:hypothetical protein
VFPSPKKCAKSLSCAERYSPKENMLKNSDSAHLFGDGHSKKLSEIKPPLTLIGMSYESKKNAHL